MSTFYDDGMIRLVHGDVIERLRELDDNSVDAVITDPPYGLEFMGKSWDGADGFRRSLNPADVERDNVFGRTSKTSPEYRHTIPGRGARVQEEREAEFTPTGQGHTDSKGPYLAARVDQYIAGSPYQEWCQRWAEECLRVLKPGGHLLAFGGTRTYHRLATAIEDAGFDIRDCLVWGYASGFPKSLDVSKAIDKAAGAERTEVTGTRHRNVKPYDDEVAGWNPNNTSGDHSYTAAATDEAKQWYGWGTALKPAWEPIVMARKPVKGTVAANVLTHGTGALNIDATRIPVADGEGDPSAERKAQGYSEAAKKALGATVASESTTGFSGEVVGMDSSKGRWPANVMLTDAIFDGGYPDEVVGGGSSSSGLMRAGTIEGVDEGRTAYSPFQGHPMSDDTYGDGGGKSRFFLVPKADRAEREKGLKGGITVESQFGLKHGGPGEPGKDSKVGYEYKPAVRVNTHPTVKPLDLMRHLVRLVTPPQGLIVDPFVGSGTTAMAASEEGFRCVGIDQSEEYLEIAKGRIMATDIGLGLSA